MSEKFKERSTAVIITFLALVLIKSFFFAALLPAWEGDDETAYWADIRGVVGETGYWLGAGVSGHGPVYPTLAAPIYRVTRSFPLNERLLLVRLLGAAGLAGMVFFTYLGAKELWPNSKFCQTVAPMLVAFNPKLSFVMASVSTDVLLFLLLSAFFYLITSFVIKPSRAKAAWFVPVLALGTFTKGRFLVAFPLLALTLLILGLHFLAKTKVFKEHRLKIMLSAAGATWLVWRLWPRAAEAIISATDIRFSSTGLAAITIDNNILSLLRDGEFGPKMFRQFWGFFTWSSGIHLTESIYQALLALTLAAGVGWLFRVYRAGRWLAFDAETGPDHESQGFVLNIKPIGEDQWRRVLALILNLTGLALVIIATGSWQFYVTSALGRYLLGASLPFALILAAGLDGLIPEKIKGLSLMLLAVGLFALNVLSVTAFMMPRFY